MNRTEVLERANEIICGERQETYGDAMAMHDAIAGMWSAILTLRNGAHVDVEAEDVALMMIAMKCARACGSRHDDNAVDIAGYAALFGEMQAMRKG